MSRAFVKEDQNESVIPALPDRPISGEANYVTAAGLAAIEAALEAARVSFAAAQASGDKSEVDRIGRDLRYWSARRSSAQVIEPPRDADVVHFGSTVTMEGTDGRRRTYRIVGEDEAEPSRGTIPYVSPLARALAGRSVGDSVKVGGSEMEIVAIS